jgi:hypothetical protein
MSEYLWVLALVGVPAVLGAAIAFGMMFRRRLSRSDRQDSAKPVH